MKSKIIENKELPPKIAEVLSEAEAKEKAYDKAYHCPKCGEAENIRIGEGYTDENHHSNYQECKTCGCGWSVSYRLVFDEVIIAREGA